MKLLLPRIITGAILALFIVSAIKALLPTKSAEEKIAVEYRICGIDDLPGQLRSPQSNKLVLVVVGDGVKDKTLAKTRPYSSNYAQGWDLYEGIAHASNQKVFRDISAFVEIVYVDDGGESRCAELVSEEIIMSPKVIAVIGHATSGTTKIALENYKKANIPVILPIATNPDLTVDCKNCFRLPSNDAVQAKAISDYAVNTLHGKNIYLVWDGSDSAKDYSEFLESEVVNLIGGSKIKFRQPINYRPMSYEHLLKSISYNKTDVLIFCGYGSMAREFLNGLNFEYKGREKLESIGGEKLLTRPRVILSDGTRISDIKEVSAFGFEAYLSFPADKLRSKSQFSNFIAETPPRGQERTGIEDSYEHFGYDALTLFALAFKRLNGDISRQLLNASLAIDNSPSGDLCYTYKFVNGENVNVRYFIYSVGSDEIVKRYDATDLNNLFSEKLMPEFLGAVTETAGSDTELLASLRHKLETDNRAEALVIITDDQSEKSARVTATKLLNHLATNERIDASRISFALGVGPKRQTELWLIPSGVEAPKPPENHVRIKAVDLSSGSSSTPGN